MDAKMAAKKKDTTPDVRLKAKALKNLEQRLNLKGGKCNPDEELNFNWGLVDMAWALGLVSDDERAEYCNRFKSRTEEIKSRKEPVYKDDGLYLYKKHYIIEDFVERQRGNKACCYVMTADDEEEILDSELTFADAKKFIDKRNKLFRT